MYTDPKIVHNVSCTSRSYVKVFISGVRYRFYNGKELGVHCNPNHTKNPVERLRLLQDLQYQVKKKLESGWRPGYEKVQYTTYTLKQAVELILPELEDEDISDRYKADVKRIATQFTEYLVKNKYTRVLLRDTTPQLLEGFLTQFSSSGTYFMTQRSNLAGIFTRIQRKGWTAENLAYKTSLKRRVPILNTVYTKEQLKKLLAYLKDANRQLYLCTLMMYGCFLRPHREIRNLKRKHLNDDCTEIKLSGRENKSKRIRTIKLPKYITAEILRQDLHTIDPDCYLVTRGTETYNPDYFKTIWTRLKQKMLKDKLITENQTLYSFRHTGAVEVYQKTKDPYKVQKAMFHSSLSVTLVYLRSLGLIVDNDVDDLPEL